MGLAAASAGIVLYLTLPDRGTDRPRLAPAVTIVPSVRSGLRVLDALEKRRAPRGDGLGVVMSMAPGRGVSPGQAPHGQATILP